MPRMEKDFNQWNKKKKSLDSLPDDTDVLFPKEGWVWMCSLGINVGFEQNGIGAAYERPTLVIKKFNNKMFWIVPLSSRQKRLDFYYNFTDPHGNKAAPNGNKAAAILAQLRLVSAKWFIRDMYQFDEADFEAIQKLLAAFMQSKPRTRRGFSRPEGAL